MGPVSDSDDILVLQEGKVLVSAPSGGIEHAPQEAPLPTSTPTGLHTTVDFRVLENVVMENEQLGQPRFPALILKTSCWALPSDFSKTCRFEC